MHIETITSTQETFANVDDLLKYFKDVKDHPEQYVELKPVITELLKQLNENTTNKKAATRP